MVAELQGEKIDIIPWTDTIADLVVSALQPPMSPRSFSTNRPSASKSSCPTSSSRSPSAVAARTFASLRKLIGWDIDILTEQEESERRQKEFTERSSLFMQALDVDEMVAQLLASEGFSTVEELAYIEANEIASIEGFDEETASEIQNRAANTSTRSNASSTKNALPSASRKNSTMFRALMPAMLVALGKDGVKTVEDFAGCAPTTSWVDRTQGRRNQAFRRHLQGFSGEPEEAEDMIMQARIKVRLDQRRGNCRRPGRRSSREEAV